MWPFNKKQSASLPAPQKQVSDSPCDQERQILIERVTKDAAGYLGVDPSAESPADVVKKVDAAIVCIVFDKPQPIPDTAERHLILGCLWGTQIVREFGWKWADVRHGEAISVGVVSPQKDMVVYPFYFVSECIAKRCICTVELSFNMLREKKGSGVYTSGSYEDIMAYIHHIVPHYTLEKKGLTSR